MSGAKAACSVHGSPSDWHKKSVSTDLHELREEFIPPEILAAKRADPQADTSQWEREIDQLVYELYGLTEDEIGIVENKT